MAERLKAAVLKTEGPKGSVGSNPTSSATYLDYAAIAQLVERLTCNEDVRGSIPRGGTKIPISG